MENTKTIIETETITTESECTKPSHRNFTLLRGISQVTVIHGLLMIYAASWPSEAVSVTKLLPGLLVFVVGNAAYLLLRKYEGGK